jgi:hypothetical protein
LEQLSDEFRDLRDGVRKAIRIADEDPEMALTRARKVLEYVVRDVYERRIQEPPGTRPLENLLQRLVKDGFFPRRLDAYAGAIRNLGNVGTHTFDEPVTVADAYRSLTQLVPILEWYFEHEMPETTAQQPAPLLPATPVGRPTGPPAGEVTPLASGADVTCGRPGTPRATAAAPASLSPGPPETTSEFGCPACGRTLRIPSGGLGKRVRCPSCGHGFGAAGAVIPLPPGKSKPGAGVQAGAQAVRPESPAEGPSTMGEDHKRRVTQTAQPWIPRIIAQRKRLFVVTAVAVALSLGLVGLWAAGILKVKTKEGVIVLENLPADADVLVDGEKVTVTWDGKNAQISVKPGTRKIVAARDGIKVIGEEVVIEDGGRRVLTARLEPLGRDATPHQAKEADDKSEGFVSLFNGKDLTGWYVENPDARRWAVEGQAIVGRSANFYTKTDLLSIKEYNDFTLSQ